MNHTANTRRSTMGFIALVLVLFFLCCLPLISSLPVGITVTSNSSSERSAVSTSRADDGGTITTMIVDVQQQDQGWKGYVGNVTGKFTLSDADNYSLYDWSFTVTTGEVYITRASSPNWSAAQCVNPTVLTAEQSYFNMLEATEYDTINKTFNETTHANFRVGVVNITNSTCPSTFLFVNSSYNGTVHEDTDFQEVLLQTNGTSDDLVYAALMETDKMGYNEDKTFDFQAIVPDNRTAGGVTTYYFFAELGY